MSQDNVDRMRALYAEMANGNFNIAGELLAPDLVYEPISDGRETYVGPAAFGEQFREFLAQWSEFRIDALELEDLGDAVLVTERQHGIGKRSRIEADRTFFSAWTFRDGLIVRARWDLDRASALDALDPA